MGQRHESSRDLVLPSVGRYAPLTQLDVYVADILPTAFSALRVYALSGRSWILGSVVFVLSLAPVAVNFVSVFLGIPSLTSDSGDDSLGRLRLCDHLRRPDIRLRAGRRGAVQYLYPVSLSPFSSSSRSSSLAPADVRHL